MVTELKSDPLTFADTRRAIVAGMYLPLPQSRVLLYCLRFQKLHGKCPTNIEMRIALGLPSEKVAMDILAKLRELGILRWSFHPERVVESLLPIETVDVAECKQ